MIIIKLIFQIKTVFVPHYIWLNDLAQPESHDDRLVPDGVVQAIVYEHAIFTGFEIIIRIDVDLTLD